VDYSNQFYKSARYSLKRKRQIINQTLAELHAMQIAMIEDAVIVKEFEGFPEANEMIKHIQAL
jgi:hypothetical protein